jgi:hypothetical protein
MRAVICVPWRGGNPSREAIWEKVEQHLIGASLQVYTGDSDPDKPFNRSAARNAAALNAGDADVYIFNDADTYIPYAQMAEAVAVVMQTKGVAMPYTNVLSMNPVTSETRQRVATGDTNFLITGNLVVHKDAWSKFHWDERIGEWGWEDGAFLKTALFLVHVGQVPGTIAAIEHSRLESETHEVGFVARPPVLDEYDAAKTPEAWQAIARATMNG